MPRHASDRSVFLLNSWIQRPVDGDPTTDVRTYHNLNPYFPIVMHLNPSHSIEYFTIMIQRPIDGDPTIGVRTYHLQAFHRLFIFTVKSRRGQPRV